MNDSPQTPDNAPRTEGHTPGGPVSGPPPLPPGNYPGAPGASAPPPNAGAPAPQQWGAPPAPPTAPPPAGPGPGAPPPWGAPGGYGFPPPGQRPAGPPWGAGPQGPRPTGPGGFSPPPRRQNPFPAIAGGVLLLAMLFGGGLILLSVLGGAGAAGPTAAPGGGGLFTFGDRIAILEINGVLGEGPGFGANTAALIQQLKTWEDNSSVKGIVVRVNSPGGAVSATQELYEALQGYRARTNRPVVVSMGDVAASGGYYAALAADRVFANPGTLTGSIGVIMSSWQYDALTERIGLRSRVIKSGEFKDIMSGTRDMTEAERALMQEMVGDVFEQFFDHVLQSRRATVRQRLEARNGVPPTDEEVEAAVRRVADGRVFTGRQAFEDGMVDELGTLDDAVAHAAQLAGMQIRKNRVPTVSGPPRPRGLFGSMEARLQQATRTLPGTVMLEYRLEL